MSELEILLTSAVEQLARLADAQERSAAAQERSAKALERVRNTATTTTDHEREAIAAFLQLKASGKSFSMAATAAALGIPRSTLRSRAENWPTFQKYIDAERGEQRELRRGFVDDAGQVVAVDGEVAADSFGEEKT